MLKGLFSGVAVSAILSVVGLATASLVAPMPEMVGGSDPEPVVAPASDPVVADEPAPAVETIDDAAPIVDTSDPVAPSLNVEPETGIQIEAPSLAPAPIVEVPDTTAPLADTTTADRPEDVEIITDLSQRQMRHRVSHPPTSIRFCKARNRYSRTRRRGKPMFSYRPILPL